MSKTGPQQSAFQPGSCFGCPLTGHFARQCPYKNRRQFIPRKPPSATITAPALMFPNLPNKSMEQIKLSMN
jgi:hypothetical protein